MGLKRKRNLKVDNTTNYAICILKELDTEYLEDYVKVHDSGMEAEEEKESQLQKIIQDQNGSIPLPIIKYVENPIRALYNTITLKKRIKWNKDCSNEYIEDLSVVAGLMTKVNGTDNTKTIQPGDNIDMQKYIENNILDDTPNTVNKIQTVIDTGNKNGLLESVENTPPSTDAHLEKNLEPLEHLQNNISRCHPKLLSTTFLTNALTM